MGTHIERLDLTLLFGFKGKIGQPRLKRSGVPGNAGWP
jgi:hypothetical protein